LIHYVAGHGTPKPCKEMGNLKSDTLLFPFLSHFWSQSRKPRIPDEKFQSDTTWSPKTRKLKKWREISKVGWSQELTVVLTATHICCNMLFDHVFFSSKLHPKSSKDLRGNTWMVLSYSCFAIFVDCICHMFVITNNDRMTGWFFDYLLLVVHGWRSFFCLTSCSQDECEWPKRDLMDTLALLRRCTAAEKRGTTRLQLYWSIGMYQ